MIINLFKLTGDFAENKDTAQSIRLEHILPGLTQGKTITIDFDGVTGTTQSFVHALISDPIRQFGGGVLDRLKFKNCSPVVQKIIVIVTEYMQASDL
jgi:hypothetical protein